MQHKIIGLHAYNAKIIRKQAIQSTVGWKGKFASSTIFKNAPKQTKGSINISIKIILYGIICLWDVKDEKNWDVEMFNCIYQSRTIWFMLF